MVTATSRRTAAASRPPAAPSVQAVVALAFGGVTVAALLVGHAAIPLIALWIRRRFTHHRRPG